MSATLPSHEMDVSVHNQYNRRRVIVRRIEHGSSTISFYDTHDNAFQRIMRMNFAHYFHGGAGIEEVGSVREGTSTAVPQFVSNKGFTPNPARSFFKRIDIIQAAERQPKAVVHSLHEPVMTSVGGGSLEYSGSDPVSWEAEFQPEWVTVKEVGNGEPGADGGLVAAQFEPEPIGGFGGA